MSGTTALTVHDYGAIEDLARGEAAGIPAETALILIGQAHSEQSQSRRYLPVLARALDTTLGMIADPDEAREMLDRSLIPEAQAELAATHGDLLSVVIQIAGPDEVLAALEMDVAGYQEQSGGLFSAAVMCRAWAQNLKDRPDWEEILEMEIAGMTFRELILTSIYHDACNTSARGREELLDNITPDIWEGVGLDPDEAMEQLEGMIHSGSVPSFTQLDVAQARRAMRERRQAMEAARQGEIKHVVVTEMVDDIDI